MHDLSSVKNINLHPNQEFWDELCGTNLFTQLGLTEISPSSIEIFDTYYLNFYSYLQKKYIIPENLKNKKVLEIGLGFGTVGNILLQHSKNYVGLDYAQGPVEMMKTRISWANKEATCKAVQGSALQLPFPDNSFDSVVSIGCLHHTGDIQKSLDEIERVLVKGGEVLIMLYNARSYRNFLIPFVYLKKLIIGKKRIFNYSAFVRSMYDANAEGDAAPIVERVSVDDCKKIFGKFINVTVEKENNGLLLRRFFLNNISKWAGLDLYITGNKP